MKRYSLTKQNQVTLPAAIRRHLGAAPGDTVVFEAMADGRVAIRTSSGKSAANRFTRWVGTGIAKRSTEQILRATRGSLALR